MLDKATTAVQYASECSEDEVQRDAQYFEYTSSANPIGVKLISPVPPQVFPPSLCTDGPTRAVPLDLSSALGADYPATGPSLLANFLRILGGEHLTLAPNATSQVCYVLAGEGTVQQGASRFVFGAGDVFALPGGIDVCVAATTTARLYYVNDAPLLAYLGAAVATPRFAPTRYPAAQIRQQLAQVAGAVEAAKRNRVSILLGNTHFPQTRTITHSMWAMFGIVQPRTMQKPHRHQSIALDFIPECRPGCYSLVGAKLDADGRILHPERIDWSPGMAFVTPPGQWHAHYNESDAPAYVVPLQDAGLQTYLRALDIRFVA